MLLSCCFRDPKAKKNKVRKDGVAPQTNHKEDGVSTIESQSLLSANQNATAQTSVNSNKGEYANNTVNANNAINTQKQQAWAQKINKKSTSALDLKLPQERYPPSKEARRLQKQRSRESVSSSSSHRLSLPYIDQSPIDPGLLHPPSTRQQSSYPTPTSHQSSLPPTTPQQTTSPSIQPPTSQLKVTSFPPPTSPQTSKQGTQIKEEKLPRQHGKIGPNAAAISVPNLSQQSVKRVSLPNSHIEKSVSVGQVEKLNTPSLQTDQTTLYSPSRSQVSSPSHSDTLGSISNCQDDSIIENEVFVSKMQRSTASYAIKDLLREQEEKEEKQREENTRKQNELEEEREKRNREREVELSNKIRAEYEAILEKNCLEQEQLINKLQSQFEARFNQATESHQKELDTAVMNGKNELNDVIVKHQKQIETIKEEFLKQEAENEKQMLAKIASQERAFRQSSQEVEERDRRWQEEKQEVLAEVQRLKAEAARMVSILAMELESEQEQLCEGRKRTLKQEVESLQLVVEMRTTEVRRLREKQALMERQLEGFEITKTELGKMKARVEDLQEQIANKSDLEKKLSLEKSKLEGWLEAGTRTSARMSLEVEQLQWRIRNNLDLPPVQLRHPKNQSLDETEHQSLNEAKYQSLDEVKYQCLDETTTESQGFSSPYRRSISAPVTGPRIEDSPKLGNNLEHVEEVFHEVQDASEVESCKSCTNDIWASADLCQSCLHDVNLVESPHKKCDFVIGAEMKRISYGGLSKFEEKCYEEEKKYAEQKPLNKVDSLITRDSENGNEIVIKKVNKESDDSGDEDSIEKFNEVVDDASDEGLGDISSENESGSPQPGEERRKLSDHFLEQNKNMIKCANKFDRNGQFLDLNIEDTKMLTGHPGLSLQDAKIPSSPSDNRVPSMMPFETPL